MLRDRGALPKGEGDAIRECKTMHDENFLSSILETGKETTEERSKKRRREGRERRERNGES